MTLRRLVILGSIFILALLLTLLLANPAWVQTNSPLPSASDAVLFTPAERGGTRGGISSSPTVVRQRYVKANTSLIPQTRGGSVTLNLFDDVSYKVVIERVDQPFETSQPPSTGRGIGSTPPMPGQGIIVQFGRVQGIPNSEVYLATQGDRLSASVRLPDGKLYEVSPTNSRALVIRELNPAAFPPDEPPGALERLQQRSRSRGLQHSASATFEVLPKDAPLKVLVLYTPKALKVVGDEQAMALTIANVEAQTNQGYRQSGVKLRVKVARWSEVDYPESGNSEKDLEVLRQAEIANKFRQSHQVDAVSLWVSKLEKGTCGLGYVNRTPAEFQGHAFTVVDIDCAINNLSFAHELGHNLGSCHNRENSKTCEGSYPYSFGYQDPEGEFRTIMAYPCKANKSCPRLNYWSNPELVMDDKKPLGVAEQVDNVRSLNHVT